MKSIEKIKKEIKSINNLKRYIKAKTIIEKEYLHKKIDPKLMNLENEINSSKYKGIIIYAEAVLWNPVQRPHHFLRELGKKGYLCFFLEHKDNNEVEIEEKYKNVYWINGEEKIIPLLKDKKVIFLITYFLQFLYSKNFPNKTIWFDVLDRLDFFADYNLYSKKIWKKLIKKADIVTYSARNLKEFVPNRKDAILLQNACNLEDFKIKNKIIPEDMKKIVNKNKKIIGYFGAIEEWLDFGIIKELSKSKDYEIVLIGKVGENINTIEASNIHYLGPKNYKDLKNYAVHFDLALIPFIVNDLTNNVSPVKFFEYLALELPILSTPIHEMKFYKSPILKLIEKDKILTQANELLSLDKNFIKEEANKLLGKNTWENRIEEIIDIINHKL